MYDVKNGDLISLKGECIVGFRTYASANQLVLVYETESRDYDSVYRLKVHDTHTMLVDKNDYYIQVLRVRN